MTEDIFMTRVLELAQQNVAEGGWPFAAVIVRNGEILSEGVNGVQVSHDPSDHAEIAAIRAASARLQSSDLSGCAMYVLGLPCPMCMTCIRLARLDRVYYAVNAVRKDAALTCLPPTRALYDMLASIGDDPSLVHADAFGDQAAALFAAWNRGCATS